MARSVTFVIDDKVDVQITVTENDDGTLTFDILVLDTGKIGDIRAIFFDLDGLTADDSLMVTSGDHVTESVFDEANVSTVGGDGNIEGSVTNEFGEFDVGIGFGTSGPAEDDLQFTSFTLGHASLPLSLDMIDVADFGIRTTSVGMKAGDTANGVAQNDVLEVDENAAGNVDLLANDTNGSALTVRAVWDALGAFDAVAGGFERQVVIDGLVLGTLTVGEDGVATFTADGADVDRLAVGETPQLVFTYETVASDGSLATADATLTVTGLNDAPTMADGALALDDDETDVTLDLIPLGDDIDSDDDGSTLIYSLAGAPSAGSASITGTTLTFDPGNDFDDLALGETAEVQLTVTATDRHGETAQGVVTVTVTGTNSAPVAQADLTTTDEDSVLIGSLFADNGSGVDFDPDGDSFTIYTVDGQPAVFGTPITLASGATLILYANGDFEFDPRGAFDFVPEGGQSADGIDYTVIDSNGAVSNEVRANFSVQGVNDSPVIVAEAGDSADADLTETDGALTADGTLTARDPDNGDEVTASVIGVAIEGDSGTLTEAELLTMFTVTTGLVVTASQYEGQLDWAFDSGSAAFDHLSEGEELVLRYTIRPDDGHGVTTSGDGVVTIRITGTNDAAVAADDALTAEEDTVLTIAPAALLANDVDPDTSDTLAIETINGQAAVAGAIIATIHGQITVENDGSLTYLADAHYSGPDSFDYTAGDGLASDTATVSIDVEAVADAPELTLASSSGGGDSTPVPTGANVQINTTTNGTQTDPSVTALEGGGFVVAWRSYEPGVGYDSYFQIYDADGDPVGSETIIGADTSGQQQFPDVLAVSDGGFIVAYSSSSGVDTSGYGVYTQRYDATGTPVGGEVLVNTTTGNTQDLASIEPLDGGGYVVTWMSFDTDGTAYNIYAQSFDASGSPVGGEVLVNSPPNPEYDTYPAVAGLAGGGYVVTWSNWVPGSGQFEAYAQIIDVSGSQDGPPIQLNTQTSSIATYSSVLAMPDGGFVVVWTQDNPGENRKLVMSRFDADGTLIEGEVEVSQVQPTIQHAPGITLLDDGGFLISWSALNAQDNSGGMFGRRYDADGVALSDEFLINATIAGQQHPTTNAGNRVLATLGDGTVVSVWGTDHGNGELFFRFVDIPQEFDGTAGQPFDIALDAALVDTDGSETLTVTLSGYPAGTTFNLGSDQGGVWVIDNAETLDLSTLQATTPADFDGGFTLTATARATEGANGDLAETTASATFSVFAQPLPALFTEGVDQINFGNPAAAAFGLVVAGDYADGTQYDALGGDDDVYLPQYLADAIAAGYDLNQTFNAGDGDDFVRGSELDDAIEGGEGRDNLQGWGGDDTLNGGAGRDNISGGDGSDVMDGGDDSDTIDWRYDTAGVTVDIGAGTSSGNGTDTFSNFEVYWISFHDDHVTDDDGNNRIVLRSGDDTYVGGAGSVWLFAGEGDDTVDGGGGSDRIDYALSSSGVSVNLTTGVATGEGTDSLTGIEQVFGSQHDDLIIGTDDSDTGIPDLGLGYEALLGRGGNDTIYGMGGNDDLSEGGDGDDQIYGGEGNDNLGGGAGNDTLDGGNGTDEAYYANTTDGIVLSLVTGIATQGADTDTLIDIEDVTGSQGDDDITGDAGANVLAGYLGDDTLTGGAGADNFFFDLRPSVYVGDKVITDFEDGIDVITLFGGGFADLSELNPQQVGSDVLLDVGNATILLENMLVGDLSNDDFVF